MDPYEHDLSYEDIEQSFDPELGEIRQSLDPFWDNRPEFGVDTEEQTIDITVPSSIGLQNMGNSCYLNAVLQIFLHSPSLFGMLKQEFFPDDDLTMINLYDNIGSIRICYTQETKINLWEQCDSRLLFCWILDRIKERYRKEDNQAGLEHFSVNLEQQIQLFRICDACQKRDSTLQIEFCTPLYPFCLSPQAVKNPTDDIKIDESTLRSTDRVGVRQSLTMPEAESIHIYKLVNAQSGKQTIERKCPHCGHRQSTQRRRTLRDPDNLFYSLESQHFRVCLDECVETPLKNTFNLKGFIVHIGHTKDYGHYVSYICNEDDEWTLYDDELVIKDIDISPFQKGTYSPHYTIKMVWYAYQKEGLSDDTIDLT